MKILHSTAIYLQNNLYVNFFDIYVYDININEVSKINRFVNQQTKQVKTFNYLTIKLAYQLKPITKKLETNW